MNEKLAEILDDYPTTLKHHIPMSRANESIEIYRGIFELRDGDLSLSINGKIVFNWFPSPCSYFSGTSSKGFSTLEEQATGFKFFSKAGKHELFIDGLKFSDCHVTKTSTNSLDQTVSIIGKASNQAIRGDKSIPVSKILFALPNFSLDFLGISTKDIRYTGAYVTKNRIELENEDYILNIDKRSDYKNVQESLETEGGYLILYYGELKAKKGDITYADTRNFFFGLTQFLSFLNGRRCAPLFRQGTFNDQEVWTDFTGYNINPYEYVKTWPSKKNTDGLNQLFQRFTQIWKNDNDSNFLETAIHWYIEANSGTGFAQGSIIMVQAALELIYNWLLIENQNLLLGRDAENISASNKIRLLLSQIKNPTNAPPAFTGFVSYLQTNTDIPDAPELFVQIRNAIVHSQEDKRLKLSSMDIDVIYDALQLGLWYLELLILFVLNHQGRYLDRSLRTMFISAAERDVPWLKT